MVLTRLNSFVRIIDAGGITRAAEQLALTQPAVSKQLKALEAEMGTALILKKGRRVVPTPAGEVLYNYAKRIQATIDQAYEAVAETGRPGQGEIHVGAVSTVAVFTLPKVLSTFTQEFPGVRVRVQISEIQQAVDGVIRGDLAVAVVTVPILHPQVDSIPLFSDPVRLVVSPSRLESVPSPLRLAELASLDFISYQNPSRFRSFVDGVLEQHGVIPHVLMEFNSHEVVRSMVRTGLGVAMVPESVVQEDIATGQLLALEVEGLPPIRRTTSLLVAKEPHRSHPLMAMMRTFLSHYGVDPKLWPGWYRDATWPHIQRSDAD
jgi:DNA-binding transcriptional LysR family regulator